MNFYERWLDETCGRSGMRQLWDYLEPVDGIQMLLNIGGLRFDPCDIINGGIKDAVTGLTLTYRTEGAGADFLTEFRRIADSTYDSMNRSGYRLAVAGDTLFDNVSFTVRITDDAGMYRM